MSENTTSPGDVNNHIIFEGFKTSREPSIRSGISNFTSVNLKTTEETMELELQLKILEDFLKPSWGNDNNSFKNIKKYLIEFHLKELKISIQSAIENQLENKSLFKHFKIRLNIDIINLMNFDPVIGNKFIHPKFNTVVQKLIRLNTIIIVRGILKNDQLFTEHIEVHLKSNISDFFKFFEIKYFSILSSITRIKNKTNEFSLIEGVVYEIMEPQTKLISTEYQCTNYKCPNQNYLHVKYSNNLAIVIKRNNLNMFQPLTTRVEPCDIGLKCLACDKKMLESLSDRVYNTFQYGTLITSKLENLSLYENHIKVLFEDELVGSVRRGDELFLLGYAFREEGNQNIKKIPNSRIVFKAKNLKFKVKTSKAKKDIRRSLNGTLLSNSSVNSFISTTFHLLEISMASLNISKFPNNQNPLNILILTSEYAELIKNILKFKSSCKRTCQISSSIKSSFQENIFNGYYEIIILNLNYLDKMSLNILLETLKEYQLQNTSSKNFVVWSIFDLSILNISGSNLELECIPEKYYEVIEYFNIAQYIKPNCGDPIVMDQVMDIINSCGNDIIEQNQFNSLELPFHYSFEFSKQAQKIFQNYFLLLKKRFKISNYFRNLDSTITLKSLKVICQAITMINKRSIPNLSDVFESLRIVEHTIWVKFSSSVLKSSSSEDLSITKIDLNEDLNSIEDKDEIFESLYIDDKSIEILNDSILFELLITYCKAISIGKIYSTN